MVNRAYLSGAPRLRGPAAGLALTGLVTVVALSGGCAGGGGSGGVSSGARPSPQTAPLERLATGGTVEAEVPTLAVVLPEVFKRMGWAELRLGDEVTALHAAALTPDGRTVYVRAQNGGDGGSRVQVRAGHFGDPVLEQRFLEELSRHLRRRLREEAEGRGGG